MRMYAVFDFYQNLNSFYGVLAECCTQQSCPTMSAGPKYVHHLPIYLVIDPSCTTA